ncbi:MAG: hypothetical protein O3A47_09025, partial [Chloroflexi bacterium]|nr:hypothetical protein [Chloroflexota bacterium]
YTLREWLDSQTALVDGVSLTPMQIIALVAGKTAAHYAPSIPPELANMEPYELGGLPGFERVLLSSARLLAALDRLVLKYQ